MLSTQVASNLRRVRERIQHAAERAARDPDSVRLVAVTKYAELDWVRALVDLGHHDLGENRPQQLLERSAKLGPGIRWHLIGHLQRNKVRKMLPVVHLIHSVDSLRLLADIERIAGELGLRPEVLLEVNLVADPNKHGFSREDLLSAWPEITPHVAPAHSTSPRARVTGLMAMAAFTETPEDARPTFAALRNLRGDLLGPSPPPGVLPHLSMGMTGDFEVAIEEGATLIRIGSALWEGL